MGIFSKREIESCTLMGVTNQCVNYKLHAILNYQEDIYANVYSFYVKYTDGTAETVQVYQQNEVDYYMSFCSKDNSAHQTPNNTDVLSADKQAKNSAIYDDLLKLEQLHEKGIIPTDLFETQKDELLKQLSAPVEIVQEPINNIVIIRGKKRPAGNAKTQICINGELKDYDLDCDKTITLPKGTYSIHFECVLLKSNSINLNITDNKIYKIKFTNNYFSIYAELI